MLKKVTLKIPARFHADVMDIKNLNIGKVGGGGIGIAINLDSLISIQVIDSMEDIINGPKEKMIKSNIELMRSILKSNNHFKVDCNLHTKVNEHCGMGSNAIIQSGIVFGINHLLGSQLSKDDLIRIMQKNYYEETNGELISKVYCSGVGHNAIAYGGVCFIDETGKLIYNKEFPKDIKLILLKAKFNDIFDVEGEDKDDIVVNLRKKNDINNFYEQKNKIIRNKIVPDLMNNKYSSFIESMKLFGKMDDSNILSGICTIGNLKYGELEKELDSISNYVMRVSSNSPFVCIMTDKVKQVEEVCNKYNLDFSVYDINNHGIEIIEEV